MTRTDEKLPKVTGPWFSWDSLCGEWWWLRGTFSLDSGGISLEIKCEYSYIFHCCVRNLIAGIRKAGDSFFEIHFIHTEKKTTIKFQITSRARDFDWKWWKNFTKPHKSTWFLRKPIQNEESYTDRNRIKWTGHRTYRRNAVTQTCLCFSWDKVL